MPSTAVLQLIEIATYHNDVVAGLTQRFSTLTADDDPRVLGLVPAELQSLLLEPAVRETELRSCLAVLSTVEAVLRLDFVSRVERCADDALSTQFLELHGKRGYTVRLDDELLQIWKTHHPNLQLLVGELRGAFRFRHWLAHGRYWEPKLGRQYTYEWVYLLAVQVFENFPLLSS